MQTTFTFKFKPTKHNSLKHYLTIVLIKCISFVAKAQENTSTEELVTDRPDATEASRTVPKGSLQVETGGLYATSKEAGVTQDVIVYNTTLLRYGILDNFELRVGWNLLEERLRSKVQNTELSATGLSPLLFGMKVDITEEKGWIPEVALIGHLFLPFTASKDFKPDFTSADFRFSLSHTLSERSSIAYNIGAQWGPSSPEMAYIYTLAYGYSLSDRWGFYLESYGDLPEKSRSNHFVDGGITYLAHPLFQVDAYVGTGLSGGQDLLVGAGVSFRIDKKQN